MKVLKHCLEFELSDFVYTVLPNGNNLTSILHISNADVNKKPYNICLITPDEVIFSHEFISDIVKILYYLPLNSLTNHRYSIYLGDITYFFKNRINRENFISIFPLVVNILAKYNFYNILNDITMWNEGLYWEINKINLLKFWHLKLYKNINMDLSFKNFPIKIEKLAESFSDSISFSSKIYQQNTSQKINSNFITPYQTSEKENKYDF